jgi:hypothetical protein
MLKQFRLIALKEAPDTDSSMKKDTSVFLTEGCLSAAAKALGVEPKIIFGDGGAICPTFVTSEKTYFRFHPCALLARLMHRCGRGDLAAELLPSTSRRCLVAAVPLAYMSPLHAIEAADIGAICDQLSVAAVVV